MTNVTPISAARSNESFDRIRWKWAEAVAAHDCLSPLAKLIAYVLVSQFAHRETADCHPGWEVLSEAVGSSPRSVRRAIVDLETTGFIERGAGGYSGAKVDLLFRFEGRPLQSASPRKVVKNGQHKVAKNDRQKVATADHQQDGKRWPDLSKKVASSDNPPRPPYKDKPNINQRARADRPRPDLSYQIDADGWRREAWDAWLSERGLPRLEALSGAVADEVPEAFVVPFGQPPADAVGVRIAEKWVEWAATDAPSGSDPPSGCEPQPQPDQTKT